MVSGLTQAAIWPGPVPGKEQPMNTIAEILAHTEDGPFWWEHGGSWTRIGQIKSPVLNIVNTPNRLHATYHLRSYSDIMSPKKLVVTTVDERELPALDFRDHLVQRVHTEMARLLVERDSIQASLKSPKWPFMTTAQENGGMRMSTRLRAPDGKSTICKERRPIRTPTRSSVERLPRGTKKQIPTTTSV